MLNAFNEKPPVSHSESQVAVQSLIAQTNLKLEAVSPFVASILTDPDVSQIIVESIPPGEQQEYVDNTLAFHAIQAAERKQTEATGLFGPEKTIPPSLKADGSPRPSESGNIVELGFLRENGVNPERVLVFRATQPSDVPKPEAYWTTDYFEAKKGLSAEMGEDKRKAAIILVATLGAIAQNGGLIKDKNDDNGLAVRRIDTDNFGKDNCIGQIPSIK